jgi:hypothetical protein
MTGPTPPAEASKYLLEGLQKQHPAMLRALAGYAEQLAADLEAEATAELQADAYDIDVRPAGSEDSVLSLSDLSFEGATSYTVLATGMLADDSLNALLVADYVTTDAVAHQ